MEFQPCIATFGRMMYGIAMAALGGLSVFGYLTFLRGIWNKKPLQQRSIILMSLCVSDLCVIFGHMIGTVIATFCSEWPWGELGCQVDAFSGMGFSFVSIGNIALLAYDTYLKETGKSHHCVNYGFYITAVWLLGLITGFLPYLGIGAYGFENELEVGCLIDHTKPESGNLTFIMIMSVLWFIIPMFTIIKYYWKLKEETGDGLMLSIIPCQMLVAWTPYALTSLITIFAGPQNVPMIAFGVSSNLFAKICLATNPYIYVFNDSKLRVACCKTLFGQTANNKNAVSAKNDSEGKDEKEKSN